VVQALDEAFPEYALQSWTRCGRLMPHVLICASWVEQEQVSSPQASSLLDKAGSYLQERAQYAEAESLLRRAIAMREQQLETDHLGLVKSLNHLSVLSFLQGKYEQIEPLVVPALSICERFLGDEHPETARSLLSRAIVSRMQGERKQAETWLKQAQTIYERCLGSQHPDTANCLSNLAVVYGQQGEYEKAQELCLRAISIYEQQLGSYHRRTALWGWYSLAELYRAQSKYDQAEPWFERAQRVCEQMSGPEHLDTMACLIGLAQVYLEQGQYEQAASLFERVFMVVGERPDAVRYAEAASFFHGFAKLSQREGKYKQAEDFYLRALANLETTEGVTLLTKREVQRDYATFLSLVGRDAEAALLDASQKPSAGGGSY
jgi:tetratricopeptide (TPR) repeat protein